MLEDLISKIKELSAEDVEKLKNFLDEYCSIMGIGEITMLVKIDDSGNTPKVELQHPFGTSTIDILGFIKNNPKENLEHPLVLACLKHWLGVLEVKGFISSKEYVLAKQNLDLCFEVIKKSCENIAIPTPVIPFINFLDLPKEETKAIYWTKIAFALLCEDLEVKSTRNHILKVNLVKSKLLAKALSCSEPIQEKEIEEKLKWVESMFNQPTSLFSVEPNQSLRLDLEWIEDISKFIKAKRDISRVTKRKKYVDFLNSYISWKEKCSLSTVKNYKSTLEHHLTLLKNNRIWAEMEGLLFEHGSIIHPKRNPVPRSFWFSFTPKELSKLANFSKIK